MGVFDKLQARMKGEVSAGPLQAYRRAGAAVDALMADVDQHRVDATLEGRTAWTVDRSAQVEALCAWCAFVLQQLVLYKYVVFSIVLIVLMIFRPQGLLGIVSIRPRAAMGGTVELLTAESAIEASELPAVTDRDAADLESASGAIVAPEPKP